MHRIRAALIYGIEAPAVFTEPYKGRIELENSVPPSLSLVMHAAGKTSFPAEQIDQALLLAQLLISRNYPHLIDAKTGPEIKLNQIRTGQKAFCSDYMEAFLGLCVAAGVPAREWGITADELKGPLGHSLVEIFDRRAGKWQIVDPFVGGWPARIDRPREGIGILDYVRGPKTDILWHVIPEATLKRKTIQEVYNAKRVSIFLIDDQRIFRPIPGNLPVAVRQAIQILTGESFHFLFPAIEKNRKLLEELMVLRISVLGGGASGGVFLVSFILFLASRGKEKEQKADAETSAGEICSG